MKLSLSISLSAILNRGMKADAFWEEQRNESYSTTEADTRTCIIYTESNLTKTILLTFSVFYRLQVSEISFNRFVVVVVLAGNVHTRKQAYKAHFYFEHIKLYIIRKILQ